MVEDLPAADTAALGLPVEDFAAADLAAATAEVTAVVMDMAVMVVATGQISQVG